MRIQNIRFQNLNSLTGIWEICLLYTSDAADDQ